jgi:hypothetical protein
MQFLVKCLHVEHGKEQHWRENSNLNVETTPSIHVKVKIEQGQGSRSGLGLGLDAHKDDLIINKELKIKRNSNLNVETTPLVHVKVEIKHGQSSRLGLGLDAKENMIRNKELKNRRNSNLNVKAMLLVHVKVKIEQGQGSRSRLGLGLDAKGEDLIKNKELIKQGVAISTPGPNVRTKFIDQIYEKRYKKYMCFHWFEHYAKGNSKVQARPRHIKYFSQAQAQCNKRFNPTAYIEINRCHVDVERLCRFLQSPLHLSVPSGAYTCKFSNPNSFPIFLG